MSLLLLTACATDGTTPQVDGSATPTSAAQSPQTATSTAATSNTTAGISITSDAFAEGGQIPTGYTCHGQHGSPPLAWNGVPAGTTALALVMDDPDAVGGLYVHWVVSDIAPDATGSPQGATPAGGQVRQNSGGDRRYLGPCPPAGTGVHHYRFTLYALAKPPALSESTPAREAVAAITAVATAWGQLVGTYSG